MSSISTMNSHESFELPQQVRRLLATRLREGSLCLVLGAGASFGFGLPNWRQLTDGLWRSKNLEPPSDVAPPASAERFLVQQCCNDRLVLASHVRDELYRNFARDLDSIRGNPLLSAVGALTMISARGNAKVVSFNYDDLVELYLRYFGLHCRSVVRLPEWASRHDVTVLHPHGYLPSAPDSQVKSPIVLTKIDYDEVVGQSANAWRRRLVEVFASHTCVFVGLSGDDGNLSSIMAEVSGQHVCRQTSEAYWGVRFCLKTDNAIDEWQRRGVFCQTLDAYDEVPRWLFSICQEAARGGALQPGP